MACVIKLILLIFRIAGRGGSKVDFTPLTMAGKEDMPRNDKPSSTRETLEQKEVAAESETERDGMNKSDMKRLRGENTTLKKQLQQEKKRVKHLEESCTELEKEKEEILLELGESDFQNRQNMKRLKRVDSFQAIYPTSRATSTSRLHQETEGSRSLGYVPTTSR